MEIALPKRCLIWRYVACVEQHETTHVYYKQSFDWIELAFNSAVGPVVFSEIIYLKNIPMTALEYQNSCFHYNKVLHKLLAANTTSREPSLGFN